MRRNASHFPNCNYETRPPASPCALSLRHPIHQMCQSRNPRGSSPYHTTPHIRTDKTNRPWTAAIPELSTPKSQISNLKFSSSCAAAARHAPQPCINNVPGLKPLFAKARQKKEVRTHLTLAHRARRRLSETAQSLSSSQVRLGWVGWYLFC